MKRARPTAQAQAVLPYYLNPPRRTGVLLGYGSLRERDIRAGIRRLVEALKND